MSADEVKTKLEGIKWINKEIEGLYLELGALESGIIKKQELSTTRVQTSRENKTENNLISVLKLKEDTLQRMAGSENQVTIDEEAWKLVLPDQWNLSGEHEKAIREGLEIFAQDINSIENKRARKYFIIHYCYMRKKTMSECVEIAGTSVTSYHRYKQIAVLNFARIHQNRELEAYK